jgi:hypothetical protein
MLTVKVRPEDFEGAVAQVAQLVESWDFAVQGWGQETICDPIRRILGRTENGLRHIGDLLIGRFPTKTCSWCRRPHDGLVCHLDVKSTTRSYERQTGKLTLEIRSWKALRNESMMTVPAVITFEPFRDCPVDQLLWVPVLQLNAWEMFVGPQTGNGSGDPYWILPASICRRIADLRCWDGWS